MDTDQQSTTVAHELLSKALQAHDSGDAMRFAQAALNAANALITLSNIEKA